MIMEYNYLPTNFNVNACNLISDSNESVVFQQGELFPASFPIMEEIRRQGKLCDVVLKVDDQSFSAHKIVLASTIPYFHAMFTHDMVESKQKEITMQGIDAVALETLLNFAYSGKLVLNKHNVQTIMVGAAFLQLHAVKDACANFLRQRFHPQNVLGIRQFADTLGCRQLVKAADKYIEEYFVDVSLSDEYLNLNMNEVLNILQRNELHVNSEEQVFEACMKWVKHCDGRGEHLPKLLAEVRLPLLTPLYLTDRVATEELIRTSHKCRDLLDEARVYHLIPERRSLLQSFRTKARSCDSVSGHIFVVGGLNKHGDSLSTVECMSPSSLRWDSAPPMSMLRSRLGVAVLRGKLYAFGGYNGSERLATVYSIVNDLLDEARVYHLIPERRSLLQSFRTKARSCDSVSGHIFVVGGLNKHGDSLSTVECMSPSSLRWESAPPMSMLRSRLGVAVLRGKLYAFGGYNGSERLATVEVFDPNRKEWALVSSMHCKRSALGATALGNVIYVCGGYDGVTSLNSVEKYSPDTDTWVTVTPMNKSRSAGAVIACEGYVYALGGHDGLSIFDSVERYDPNTDTWTECVPMLTKRCRLGVAMLGGKIYACGGYDGSCFLQTVEMFDPFLNKWQFVSPMNAQRSRVALTSNMGKLWAVGGYDGISNLVSVEVYDPGTNTWNYVTSMSAHEGGVGVGVLQYNEPSNDL